MVLKLSEEALLDLGAALSPVAMKAFDFMAKGQKVPSSVTKVHLENIIKFLIREKGWVEEENLDITVDTNEQDHDGDKDESVTCSKCDKKFDKSADFEKHECAHTGEES